MEDNIQKVIVVIISTFLLFIFPVYMAYEKKDDVSYALAMRYTEDLVDTVRSKGYITKDMYDSYKSRLKVTGNTYDIQLTHEYLRYDPITNYYTKDEFGKLKLLKSSTQEERLEKEETLEKIAKALGKTTDSDIKNYIKEEYEKEKIFKVEDTYAESKEVYNTEYILGILNTENKLKLNAENETVKCSDEAKNCSNAYIMNEGDTFNVIIKNTNTTLATLMYNMVTANVVDTNTRIYVNYGGQILSTKWFGQIDYSKMKHDNVSLSELELIYSLPQEIEFSNVKKPELAIVPKYDGEYTLALDVKPDAVTELRQKGDMKNKNITIDNFVLGNDKINNSESTLSLAVGVNGISMITSNTFSASAKTETAMMLPTYDKQVKNTLGNIVSEKEQRRITDYSSITFKYISQGKIQVSLIGRAGVENYTKVIDVIDKGDLLNGINKTITNPTIGSNSFNLGEKTSQRGTKIMCNLNFAETSLSVSAIRYESNETTILSYPVTIDSYVGLRIEVRKNLNAYYVASLYIDDEKVADSIEMEESPKINTIGKTRIGQSEIMWFKGSIKNLELYN